LERLAASLLFIRNIVLKIPNTLRTYPTRHATRGLFTVPKIRTNSRKCTVLYGALILIAWNFLPFHIAQINSKPGFKKPGFKATPRGTTPLPYLT
jgi:hypothetical protein